MTKLIKCDCRHKTQDEMYENGIRVMNMCVSTNKDTKTFRCSVCLKEHSKTKEKTKEELKNEKIDRD